MRAHYLMWCVWLMAAVICVTCGGWASSAANSRDEWQQPDRVINELSIAVGSAVADIGCGWGYFTFRLRDAVGQKGKVFAVDVDETALKAIRERIERDRLTGIDVIASDSADPKLALGSLDAAMFCNVLHDVAQADQLPLIQRTARALKPGGTLCIIDPRQGYGPRFHPSDAELMSREQMVTVAQDAGLSLDAEFHYLKHQVFLRFRKSLRPASEKPEPVVFSLWPDKLPGTNGANDEGQLLSQKKAAQAVDRLTFVTRPTITLYRPPKENDVNAAVLICPDAGCGSAADSNGANVARWLNSLGVTGAVLKCRAPAKRDQPHLLVQLQDAQRAMRLVRTHAHNWNIDPTRIGILGLSAGGHLAAAVATNFSRRYYEPVDQCDTVDCRPDFTVLLHPACLTTGGQLVPEIATEKRTPPAFLAHAADDHISPENSIRLCSALQRAGVPIELHLYASGGNGFGSSANPSCNWRARCEQWMRYRQLLVPCPGAPANSVKTGTISSLR